MAITIVSTSMKTAPTSAEVTAHAPSTAGLEDDIALLGFRVASNGSLAKYNLVDQTVDDFQDASGVDAGSSTNESRDSSGKYYVGETTITPTATGGTVTTSGDYTYHAFTSTGSTNYVNDTTQDVEYVIVAGGGGGGWENYSSGLGGGGGAGGVRHATGYSIPAGTYAVVVGTGGAAGGAGNPGASGVASSLAYGSISAAGGGGGGGGATQNAGSSGGSGGGGGHGGGGAGNTPSTSPVQGYGGAGGTASGSSSYGGGGGGAGSAAGAVDNWDPGVGVLFSNFTAWGTDSSNVDSTGSNGGWFGGGGAGGDYNASSYEPGGKGGGGNGKVYNTSGTGQAGHPNTGGGGGNGQNGSGTQAGGVGGTGIVLLRRLTSSISEGANMTLVSTTTAAQAAPTKGDIVFTYTNGAGSTTLGTDVTAEISADGGSTWTAMTLGSEGSTGSHNIATAHDVTISSTITSPYNMAYRIKTLNQSASKTTRIQAVSLGWS